MPLPGLPADGALPADDKLWELRKGALTAVCWRRHHPQGVQLRIDVNGDTLRTTIEPDAPGADEASRHMREAMLARGWQA